MNSIPCPLGDGGYDCTPFCPSCEGNQFIEVDPCELCGGIRESFAVENNYDQCQSCADLESDPTWLT